MENVHFRVSYEILLKKEHIPLFATKTVYQSTKYWGIVLELPQVYAYEGDAVA